MSPPESSSAARLRALIVFARAPQLGNVKTRLAADVGAEAALVIYKELAERVIGAVQREDSWSLSVAFTPADVEGAMRNWLGDSIVLRPQSSGDLGARMASAIENALADGTDRAVVVGTDCPDITAAVIEDAFARLEHSDVVFGPATDGGYYLVGMSRVHRCVFEGIPWSSPGTLAASMEGARASGLEVDLLAELSDVDTADDWRAWRARSGQRPHAAS